MNTRTLFIFLLLALGVQCFGQEPLYPYRSGALFGFCTKDRKVVIPVVYKEVSGNDNFCVCTDTNGVTVIFNNYGKLLDSAYDVYNIGTKAVLLVTPYNVAAMRKFIAGKVNRRYPEWEDFIPSTAWIVDSSGARTNISDTVVAVSSEHLWLRLRNGEKQGIYDANKKAFIVPMTVDSISIVRQKFMLVTGKDGCKAYTLDGKVYNVPQPACDLGNIYDDGQYFETQIRTHQKKAIYDGAGKLVMPENKYWTIVTNDDNHIIGFYVQDDDNRTHLQDIFELYNAQGKFIRRLNYLVYAAGNCILASVYDSMHPGVPKKYLYDLVKDKWQLMDTIPSAIPAGWQTWEFVKMEDKFVTVHQNNFTTYYSGLTGERLFVVPDSLRFNARKQEVGYLEMHEVSILPLKPVRYNFVRIKMDEPLTLYDPQLHVLNKIYDSILQIRSIAPWCNCVKRDGKWGMVNNHLKETIKPEYDKIEFRLSGYQKSGLYANVTKGNRSYWIDTNGNMLFGGMNYDAISEHAVNGKWLAYEYKELSSAHDKNYKYKVVSKAFIVNSSGVVSGVWKGSDSINFVYALTVNGKILRYTPTRDAASASIQLFDPETNKTEVLPYVCEDIKTFQNGAILIVCKNREGLLALFSALDLKPVLPFGDYEDEIMISEVATTTPNKENGVMVRYLEKNYKGYNQHWSGYMRELGGFYSVTGIKFWND